jgi:hypothetical protein
MRGRLHINGTIVREITPTDLNNALTELLKNGDRAINDVTEKEWDNALLAHSDLINGKATEDIKQMFIKLNDCFFVQKKTAGGQVIALKLSRIATDLHHRCASLIERGHVDCWHYGWSFFLLVESRFQEK